MVVRVEKLGILQLLGFIRAYSGLELQLGLLKLLELLGSLGLLIARIIRAIRVIINFDNIN